MATPPVAEPERLQSQLQGPAATQHLIETCQAQRWKVRLLTAWKESCLLPFLMVKHEALRQDN